MSTEVKTVLVCGGRNYADTLAVKRVLDALPRPVRIVSGGASGADHLAEQWAISVGADLVVEPADWKTHGRAAGPIRNQKMLDEHKPDEVIAFPGGKGTEDMKRRAAKAGVPVREAP